MYLVSMTTQMTKCIHIPTKTKIGDQFLDFIKRVDRKYDSICQANISCTG